MKRLITLVAATIALAACETVEGVGQDVEIAGEGIQDASNEVQN